MERYSKMQLTRTIFIIMIILKSIRASLIGEKVPCHLLDSINITDGTLQPDNSVLFNGIKFPKGHYATVKHIVEGKERFVEPHMRGCPCFDIPCLRLCCPYGQFVESMEYGKETVCREDKLAKNFKAHVTNEQNRSETISLHQHFGFVHKICKTHSMLDNYTITNVISLF